MAIGPHEHDLAARAHKAGQERRHGRDGGGVEHDICKPALGADVEVSCGVMRVEQDEPELFGKLAPAGGGFHQHDVRSAGTTRHQRDEQAHGPGAGNHHVRPHPHRRTAHRVCGHRERLGQRCKVQRDPVRDDVKTRGVGDHAARKASIAIDADQPQVGAHVSEPEATRNAAAARDERIEEQRLTGVLAASCNTNDLVSEDQREAGAGMNALGDVQVGAADTHVGHVKEHLACAWHGIGTLFEGERVGAGENECLHQICNDRMIGSHHAAGPDGSQARLRIAGHPDTAPGHLDHSTRDAHMTPSERLYRFGVVPVIRIPEAHHALPLAEALLEGGLACAEITFRSAAAAEALPLIRAAFPDLYLGAGTVLTVEQADTAIDAGAEFIVAPGTNHAVVDHVLGRGVPMLPGVCTPSEIEAVLAKGIDLVKFFPAEQFGGINTIRAFAGPYSGVRYVPTGGVTAANLGAYLAIPQVVACGGTWMVKADLLEAGDWAAVTRLAREAVEIVAAARAAAGAHS